MNRFAALGLAYAAAGEGRRVLVVADGSTGLRRGIDEIARLDIRPAKVSRVNGAEKISYPLGGYISFTVPGSPRHRGLSFDIVYLDGLDPLPTEDQLDSLRACVTTSPRGEIVQG